jgi:hypothetical protein
MSSVFLVPMRIHAGVVNPDISALGQVLGGITDDTSSRDKNQPTLQSGEVEVDLDGYLNPYVKGAFVISADNAGDFNVEEAYASVVKGLPYALGIKAGKYRLGFGKINPMHPHALPFIDPPRSVVSLLPGGEDGFNETGVQVSDLLPTPGDWASTISADVIQGQEFHPSDDRTRLGWLGRWANDFLLGDEGALETGISGATGIDSIGPNTRTYLLGADVKAKFYLPGASQLTVQAEGIIRDGHRSDTISTNTPNIISYTEENRWGAYAFFDYRYHTQYNGGALYEEWEREGAPSLVDKSFKVFAGYAVLEESTLLRMAYERYLPEGGKAVDTFSMQLLFAMGPHKAHQF